MKRGRLPLTALRSFEVAGRHQSFTRAAEELFISQAAISRQIRELESLLGHALFERRHRAVALTPAGQKLLQVLSQSFDNIDDCLISLKDAPSIGVVKVSVESTFAGGWLIQRLSAFNRDFPEIDVAVDADPRLIAFRGDHAQLAIRHSVTATHWPRTESIQLAKVELIPVAAPRLLQNAAPIRQASDLLTQPLLHEEGPDLWKGWFADAGISDAMVERGPVYGDGGLILQAALRGQGIALIDSFLATEELAEGRLVRLFDCPASYGAYFLVARSFPGLSDAAASFARWLLGQFAIDPTPYFP